MLFFLNLKHDLGQKQIKKLNFLFFFFSSKEFSGDSLSVWYAGITKETQQHRLHFNHQITTQWAANSFENATFSLHAWPVGS